MTHTLIKPLEELRERMIKHSSYKIAKVSGLAPNTVRAIRNGVSLNPTIGTLIKIHNALNAIDIIQAAENLK